MRYDNLDNDALRFLYASTGDKALRDELKRRLQKEVEAITEREKPDFDFMIFSDFDDT